MKSLDILTKEYGKFNVSHHEKQNEAYEGMLIETVEKKLCAVD